MSPMHRTHALLATLLVLSSGCAAFVSKDEYRDYRAVRMAQTERERLLALGAYAERHRDGHWIDEIEHGRHARELAVFESGKSTRDGLELYLRVYPGGTFAEQARSRLTAVAAIEARKRAEAEQAERLAAQRKQREAELQRTWVTRFSAYWLRTFATLQAWGAPIAEVAQRNPSFSRAFGRPPRPRCTRETCVKVYESAYAVPVPSGTRIERVMQLALRLEMKEGRVVAAELLAPRGGFSRWRELEEQKPTVDTDTEHRSAAVQWAFERLRAALLATQPSSERLASVTLPEIAPLAIAASGEATDTTAEDPSAPANRLSGDAAASDASGEGAESIARLVEPEQPQQVDMDFAPVRIDAQGRAHAQAQTPTDAGAGQGAPAPSAAEGEEMVLAPLVVPPNGTTAADSGASSNAPSTPSAPLPAAPAIPVIQAQAYRAGDVRVVFFADAPVAGGGSCDGLRIERFSPP